MKTKKHIVSKTRIKKEDIVVVIAGKERGKKGRVRKVLRKTGRVIVEGVNFVKKNTRKSQKNPHGGIITFEAPISADKVMIYCDAVKKGNRIGVKCLPDGSKIRVFKATDEAVGKA